MAAELDYITIHGFKSIKAIDKLKLRKCNIIIGANGTGKSNFIETFSFLKSISEGRVDEYVGLAGGAENLLFMGSKTTRETCLTVSFDHEQNTFKRTLEPNDEDSLLVTEEGSQHINLGLPMTPDSNAWVPKSRPELIECFAAF